MKNKSKAELQENCENIGKLWLQIKRHMDKEVEKRYKLLRREFRSAKTQAIVAIVFMICLSPFYFTLMFNHMLSTNNSPKFTISITLWLLLCNSAVNPILLHLFNKRLRNAVKNMFRIFK